MNRLVVETINGRPTVDFDHASTDYRDHWREMADDLHATGIPIAWVDDEDGGFWLLASGEQVQRVASDWETFTSENDLDGTGNGGRGQRIPQMPYRLFLGESDPPAHSARRAIEAPFFTPKSLRRWRPVALHYLHDSIDQVIERGQCDLVDDILIPTAARTTLYLLGYDATDYRDAAAAAHKMSFLHPSSPDYPYDEAGRMRENFRAALLDRRENPVGDILSELANGTENGEPLDLDAAESMVNALVFGGFDTTVSLTAHALRFMQANPDQAARWREDSSVRRNFVEELLRVFPPTGHMARTAAKDTDILGQQIRAGERIYMWLAGANRDGNLFDNPGVFNPDRANASSHLSFSAGHHRCLGSPLAKIEVEQMLTTISERMPDMWIDEEKVVRYPSIAGTDGFSRMPATFTPGERVNVTHPDPAYAAT
ncbi:cytochrome P450 [Rhodococcoides fascians]|uniref:cytochrome P450 n=1 Tax=Rhodococcoides fascians TaxID=1828 RepID=UPI0005600C05|nr:cytochrome P450 [Rhodococcus fascians]